MPQPKSPSTSSRATRKPAAAKAEPAAAKPKASAKAAAKPKAKAAAKPKAKPAAKPAAKAKAAPARTRAAAKPKATAAKAKAPAKPKRAAAKPKPAARPKAAAKPKAAPKATPAAAAVAALPGADQLPESLTAVLETLHRGVVLQRERLQEVVDDAVSRGRLTRGDAEDLVQSLMVSGRRQAEDILTEVEKALDRGLREVGTATSRARKRTAASPVTREVDRARRRIGVGGFPILGYDDLTASKVVERLADLTPPQLRKVRDYERRNGARKSVLTAIERKLD